MSDTFLQYINKKLEESIHCDFNKIIQLVNDSNNNEISSEHLLHSIN